MTHVTQALSNALLHFIWQGIAGALLLAIALFLLRKRSPNYRYFASCAVLALLGLAPLVTGWVSYQDLSGGIDSVFHVLPARVSGVVVYAIPDSTSVASLRDFQSWVLPLWTAGVMVFALRLAWASRHASSLRRYGVNAEDYAQSIVARLAGRAGIDRPIRVLTSALAEVPAVVGWLRPAILLPVAVVTGLTTQQLEALVAHELAHVRRYDYLVNVLQMVVETLLFYHPAVWWVSSRIRYERELCCDDLAVRLCGDAVSYARALTQLEKMRPSVPTLAMGSAYGPLFHRVQRLLGSARTETGPSRLACAAGLLVGVLFLGLFMKSARAQEEPATPKTPAIPPPAAPMLPPHVTPVPPLPQLAGPVLPPAVPQNPLPPIAPLPPPSPQTVAPPVPAIPPNPPTQAFASDTAHWVLFRGSDMIVHGDASDAETARKAREPYSGDVLWFQLDGKSYVTQDRDVLEGIQLPGVSSAYDRVKLAYDKTLADQRTTRDLQELARQLEEKRGAAHGADQVIAEFQQNFEDLQKKLANIAAANERLKAELEITQSKLQEQRRSQDFLRDAVRAGKAQVAP